MFQHDAAAAQAHVSSKKVPHAATELRGCVSDAAIEEKFETRMR